MSNYFLFIDNNMIDLIVFQVELFEVLESQQLADILDFVII